MDGIKKKHVEDRVKRNKRIIRCMNAVPSRIILYVLLFAGMMSLFIMRLVMPITLLAMVKDQKPKEEEVVDIKAEFCLESPINRTANSYGGTLDWSMDVQYYVLTSFYWTYVIGQIPGGIVSHRFSVKSVLFYSFLAAAICNFAIPLASNIHYILLVVLQLINGLAQSMVWPAYYRIISFWSPVTERSRFTTSFLGLSFGTTIGQVMAGFVIARLGWPYVFYIASATGFLWTFAWYFLAFDTPEEHPRISPKELRYIQSNRGFVDEISHSSIPWSSILRSVPVWAIVVANFGRLWLASIIMIYGSLYLKTVIGLDVESNGLWSGMPSFAGFFFTGCVSYISDTILKHNYISLLNNRRLFSGISQIIPGALCFYFTRLNCNVTLILIIWTIIQIVQIGSYAGSMVNVYDIAPNHAGPIMGFAQLIIVSPTIIASYVLVTVIKNHNVSNAWQIIFDTAGAINLFSVVVYLVFASANIQTWDRKKNLEPDSKDDVVGDLL